MDDLNPYAASLLPAEHEERRDERLDSITCWRDGEYVVLRVGAALPPRCFRSNEPADTHRELTFLWTPLSARLPQPLAALMPQRTATAVNIRLPLSQAWLQQARCAQLLGLGFCVISMVVSVALGAVIADYEGVELLVIGGFGVAAAAAAAGLSQRLNVRVADIHDGHIWLTGAGRHFLSSLPNLPD